MNAFKFPLVASLLIIVGLAGLTAWLVAGDPVSRSKWDSVRVGMTKKEVFEIMGEPRSYDGPLQIEYSRFLNVGWVEFTFDEERADREK